MRGLVATLGTLALLCAGCGTTSRRVVARRELGQVEQRSGACVSRGRARTKVEVLGGGALRLDVQVLCGQQYVTRTRSEVDIAEPSSGQSVGGGLQAAGVLGVLAGGAIGMSGFSEFGKGIGGGCDTGCPDDGSDDSSAGSITALVGAGLLLTGVVVTVAAGEERRTVSRERLVSRRVALETRPATQPFLVRAPSAGTLRATPDEHGRAVVRLPAELLVATDRDALAMALAQPWTLVIEGRIESWTPTAIEVQQLLAAEPFGSSSAAGATSITPGAAAN